MKVSKAGVWVCLVLSVLFIIAGAIFVLLPNNSPLDVNSGSLKLTQAASGRIYIYGELENKTDKDLTVTYMEVVVETTDEIITVYSDEPVVIAAGQIYDLHQDEWIALSYHTPQSINKITATIDGVEYTVYENMPVFTVAAIAMFIFAIIFAIITITSLVNVKKEQKKYNDFADALMHSDGNGVLVGGTYSQKGEAGKAAAKTAASAVGGALSAAFLGVGFYKVYGGNAQRIFVVTDDGLYVGVNGKGTLALANMNFIQKGTFGDCEITTKKNQVILTNNVTAETFRFNTQNSNVTAEQLSERLRELVEYKPEPVAPATETTAEEATPPADDPFKDL